jgi:hypothetical protein
MSIVVTASLKTLPKKRAILWSGSLTDCHEKIQFTKVQIVFA